jgi:hypothetical protein
MRIATIVVVSLLALTGCDRAPAPPPPDQPHVIRCGGSEDEPDYDRITANILRSEADSRSTTRPGDLSERPAWEIRISGRVYPVDDAGLARLEAVLKELGAKRRQPTPPHLSERALIIRAEPDTPYGMVEMVVERAARAGFYRFEVGVGVRRPSSDSGPSSRR